MSIQLVRNAYLLGLAAVVVGAVAQQSVVKAQEERPEVVAKTRIEGSNPADGEMYRGDILTGAEKDAFLKAHNDARKAVGLEPLIWSNDIAH